MSLQYRYQQLIDAHAIKPDAQQQAVIEKMLPRYEVLIQVIKSENKKNIFSRLFKKKSILGLYLWGEVGIGKTFLLDLFFDALPFLEKKRLHFHVFMRYIHEQLRILQGTENPLTALAKKIRSEAMVLCFDEMLVEDIADAMLLGDLLKHLFQEGVCLITTSNQKPDDLYLGGLQRQRFLPAIELIKKNTEVLHLLTKTDYRQQYLKEAGTYYFPLNAKAESALEKSFLVFAVEEVQDHAMITIQNRSIPSRKLSGKTVWFEFSVLCETARSALDFIELTERFDTILLSGVPELTQASTDVLLRFIRLIDVLYDAHTQLILSAAVPIKELYRGERYGFVFQRTASRLVEMGSW